MTGKQIGIFAAIGSAMLLGAAFVFQALGYAPCAMCIWQRYPHVFAIVAGLVLAIGFVPVLALLSGLLASALTSALGLFHTGVERDWWEGPTSCSGSGDGLSGLSASELLPSANDQSGGVVMCDEVAWEFLTLSMASWNALWSFVLVVVWLVALISHVRSPR